MFKKLTDFSYTRSGKEAFGFYLAYLLLTIIISAIASSVFSGFSYPSHAYQAGVRIGSAVAVVCSIIFSLLVVSKKKLTNNLSYILISLLAGILASFGGGLIGLIIPAILTTKKSRGKK